MFILFLGRHILREVPEGTWWYDDAVTWVTAVLMLARPNPISEVLDRLKIKLLV